MAFEDCTQEHDITDFEALWRHILDEAAPEAIARAQRSQDAITAARFEVELELSVFTEEDSPWLPSVWLTPVGKDQFLAAQAGDDDRCLMVLAFGDDGDVYLNEMLNPVTEIFTVDEPENARAKVTEWVSVWIERLWTEHFDKAVEVVHEECCCHRSSFINQRFDRFAEWLMSASCRKHRTVRGAQMAAILIHLLTAVKSHTTDFVNVS
ncbi:hypothetical protein CQ018_01495 [Arthrobacter sp. MYb227]|uniref:DUF6389 family protein n=1 Tax=Arthrobacter sp. MYb227 TaxID=1848601 RepID=UPI000CFD034B|nr:DUF6389 family protein [Arthrobacter sp. MYb227]PQZ95988.1 hypothetical protein CQ018_01495 [Arthrobacter sp. MYb227]